jgi:RNA polymerase sigma-70 factor (ECF subfamily)
MKRHADSSGEKSANEQKTFDEFIRRVRRGDVAATEELVRRYEPMIRREVRLQLQDPRLTRLFDSIDVCQSVLASFFLRAAAGQYDLRSPPQLVNLLVEMARRKLAFAARRQYRQRRDIRRTKSFAGEVAAQVGAPGPDPVEAVASAELLERFRQCLSAEERQLAEWRSDGISWAEIAERAGGTADSRRVQLVRAVDRVVRRLGLDE